ncbi:hypothetical protein BU17DRAFT_86708 [Hysterangium stoloniferum]|nr:hypothetical protein BU17DRAFT_86708 [Hysterangium stoloniferum]
MSILLGYQLPCFNRGFSLFAAAVTGFKLLANIKLNLEQAARLFGLLQRCVSGSGYYLLPVMFSLTGCVPVRLHPFSKGSLAMVLMSKPFKGGPSSVAHLPHALRVHIKETICRELKQRQAVVIGNACIALIYIALVFTLFGAIVYVLHSRLQNTHVRPECAADRAPAVDDGNVEVFDPADHPPLVNSESLSLIILTSNPCNL